MKLLLLNQQSNGKYRREVINNRPHILTDFVAIVANSVMNEILYPADLVLAAAKDLVGKLAPAYHPQVSGMQVSAEHPLAINAHNIGGFVADVRVEGDQVIATIAIDEELAGKDERGKQIVSRIENGETIACSTGLGWDCTERDDIHNGRRYRYVMNSIKWDHLAILLDESPAGETCYSIVNCAVNRQDDIIDDNLLNQPNKETPNMDLETLLKVLIANGKTTFIPGDEKQLKSMSENDLVEKIVNSVTKEEPTLDQARSIVEISGLVVNKKDELQEFIANKAEFHQFKKVKADSRKELIAEVVTNSKLTEDQLKVMTDTQIQAIKESLAPVQDYSPRGSQILENRELSAKETADYN